MKNFLRTLVYASSLLFCIDLHAQVSNTWVSDLGNGRFKNPILNADYSDPDAIRVGDDYYMVTSSFNCMPGLPILHSKDLVNWKIANYALKKQEPASLYDLPQHGKGVWAPAIRYHNQEYYIYYPDPDFGIYMIKSKDPLGDWSKPVMVLPGRGIIDPCPFWDDDGKAYLAVGWAGSRAGVNSLLTLFKISSDGTKVLDDGVHIFDGHEGNHTVEGPKIYKRNNYYYVFAPAGGVATGWQLVLRSEDIYGPYEQRIVMAQGKSNVNGPHQGALMDTKTGESWFLHFQDKGAYGRVVHLQPVKWVDNWPVIGHDEDGDGKGEPVVDFKKPNIGKEVFAIATPPESDEFKDGRYGLQWQWHANPKIQWWASIKGNGFIRLFATPQVNATANLWNAPNLLLQKIPAPEFTATVKMKWTTEWDIYDGKKAGIIMMGNDYAYAGISQDEKGFKVSQVVLYNAADGKSEQLVAEKRISGPNVYLRIHMAAPNAECTFSYSEDGQNFQAIGKEFKAAPDKWIGAKVGLFCVSRPDVRLGGYVDVDWFHVTR